jgi:hypothetical protein
VCDCVFGGGGVLGWLPFSGGGCVLLWGWVWIVWILIGRLGPDVLSRSCLLCVCVCVLVGRAAVGRFRCLFVPGSLLLPAGVGSGQLGAVLEEGPHTARFIIPPVAFTSVLYYRDAEIRV